MTLPDVLFLFATRRCSENKIPPDSLESKRIEGEDSKMIGQWVYHFGCKVDKC